MKSKNNTAKIKDLFLKVWYPVFDTHLAATLTISSEKDSKYAGVPLNWLLAIILLDQCPLGLFLSNMNLEFFSFAILWLKELRLIWITKNHCFFKQQQLIYWKSFLDHYKRRLFQMLNMNSCDMQLLWRSSRLSGPFQM